MLFESIMSLITRLWGLLSNDFVNGIIDTFSATIDFGPTLGEISWLELIFGVGIFWYITYTLVKWVADIIT